MGYAKIEAFDPSTPYEVEIIGEPRPARIQSEPLFDPKGERMRG
jgi:dimethylglycine dehydrogenase